MQVNVTLAERKKTFPVAFEQKISVSSGTFESGYSEGYEKGSTEGYTKGHTEGVAEGYETGRDAGYSEGYSVGHAEGLAARTYEVWTITLTDGATVEKEVALV